MNVVRIFGLMLSIGISTTYNQAFAEDECVAAYNKSFRNINVNRDETSEERNFFNHYCRTDGSTREFTSSASFKFPIKGVPIGASGTGNWLKKDLVDFCQSRSEMKIYESKSESFSSIVVPEAMDSFNQCIALKNKGVVVSHEESHPTGVLINFQIKDDIAVDFHGLSGIGGVNKNKINCLLKNVGFLQTSEVITETTTARGIKKHFAIQCTRFPVQVGGEDIYAPIELVVGTSRGNYPVYLAANRMRGHFLALQSETRLNEAIQARTDAETERDDAVELARDRKNVVVRRVFHGPSFQFQPLADIPVNCSTPEHLQSVYDKACPAGYTKRDQLFISRNRKDGDACESIFAAIVCQQGID